MDLHKQKSRGVPNDDSLFSQSIMLSENMTDFNLFGEWPDLKRYKIVDALSTKVLLARDFARPEDVFALKVVQKSSHVFKKSQTCLLPMNVPNMCKLQQFYESDEVIVLVMKYFQRGRLYETIAHIFDYDLRPDEPVTGNLKNTSVIKASSSFIRGRSNMLSSGRSRLSSLEAEDDMQIIRLESDHKTVTCIDGSAVEKVSVVSDDSR